jgi:RimJ/RimL family protein N-acetyltransferase
MATVTLALLTEAEFAPYLQGTMRDYAAENVKAGYWSEAEAQARAEKVFAELLPDGVKTAAQHLYSIRDAQTGEPVGVIWLHENERRGMGFIYDFVIFEAFRRRGYGTQALLLLEDEARRMKLPKLHLHVFGHNTVAKALYEKVGYTVTSYDMAKPLE